MFELQYAARSILSFVSAGNLKNKDGFLHSDRQIDTFVLLFCKEGQLCIAQEERKYALSPNQYLLLFPGMRHYGYGKNIRHTRLLLVSLFNKRSKHAHPASVHIEHAF